MDLKALPRRQAACNLMQRLSCPIVIVSEHQARFSDTGEMPEVLLFLREFMYIPPDVTTNPSLDLAKFLILSENRILRERFEKLSYRIRTFHFRESILRQIVRRTKVDENLFPILSVFLVFFYSVTNFLSDRIDSTFIRENYIGTNLLKSGTSRADVRRRVRPG